MARPSQGRVVKALALQTHTPTKYDGCGARIHGTAIRFMLLFRCEGGLGVFDRQHCGLRGWRGA